MSEGLVIPCPDLLVACNWSTSLYPKLDFVSSIPTLLYHIVVLCHAATKMASGNARGSILSENGGVVNGLGGVKSGSRWDEVLSRTRPDRFQRCICKGSFRVHLSRSVHENGRTQPDANVSR